MQERAPDAVSARAAARAAARSTSLQPRRGPTLSRQHPGSPFHVVSLHGCTGTANPQGPRHLCNHRRTSQNSSGNGVTAPACQVPCSLTCRPAYASKLKMAGARICGPDLHRAGWGFGHYHGRLINGWLLPARPLFYAVSISQARRFIATETRQKAMALNEEPNRPYFCMPIS
jgi:hypothetical protein